MAELGLGGIITPTPFEDTEAATRAALGLDQPATDTEPEELPLLLPSPAVPANEALSGILEAAAETTPQETAADLALSKALGITVEDITGDNREEFKKKKIRDDLIDNTEGASVTQGYVQLDETLAKLLAGDPDNVRQGEIATQKLTFSGALSNGVTVMKSLGYRFVEAVGEVVSEDVEAFAQAKAEALEAQLGQRGVKQSFQDIWSGEETAIAGKLWDWMRQTAGEVLPLMAPSLAGGAAGFGIGLAVGGPAAPATAIVGSMIGAFIPSVILGTGETQGSIKQRDASVEAPGVAFIGGIIIGALDTVLIGKLGSLATKAVGRKAAGDMFTKIAFKTMALNAAAQGTQGLTVEALTEGLQFVVSETFAASATDTEIDPVAFTHELIENMAAGALMGWGATSVTSVGTDIVKSRRVKRAMDESSRLEKVGQLKTLSAEKAAELKVGQMQATGIEEVFVPVEVLMQYAGTQADPVAALETLGVPLTTENLAELRDLVGTTKIAISLEKFAEHLHGTEAYDMIAPHLTVERDAKSLAESIETAFEDEAEVAEYEADLEAYDAAVETKIKVAAVINKVKAEPKNGHKIIEAAGREVEVILDTLIQNVQDRKGEFASILDAARTAQLDEDLAKADQEIVALQEDLKERVEEGRATKEVQKRLDAKITARDKLVEEQAGITARAKKAALVPEVDEALVRPTENAIQPTKVQPATDDHVQAFTDLAEAQRGTPEVAMLQYQDVNSGVMSSVVEHLGDLTHRMSERFDFFKGGLEFFAPKVKRVLSTLQNPYGFTKEHTENIESNAKHAGEPVAERQARVDAALTAYADAHSQLIVYNRPQWLAREAAVAVGRQDFAQAEIFLQELQDLIDQGSTVYEAAVSTFETRSDGTIMPFEEQGIPQLPTADIPAAPARGKFVKVKAKVLEALRVKITKEDVRQVRAAFKAGLKAGENLNKAQQELVKAIDKLEGLLPKDKKTLTKMINSATTLAQLETRLKKVEFRTAEFVERNRRNQIVTALHKVLKKTRTTGGVKRIGKYTADVQRFFDDARVWLRIDKPRDERGRVKDKFRDQEAMEIELIRLMTGTKEDPIPDPSTLVQRQLLAIGSGSKEFQVNTIDLENLLITINEMMEAERKANLDKINKARTHKNKDVKDGREFTTEGKPTAEMKGSGFWGILKRQSRDLRTSLSGWHNGWDELLDIIFNKKGVDARRLIESLRLTKEIQKHKGRILKWQEELLEVEKKIYGITGHADLMDKQRADNVETDFGVQQLAQTDEEAEVGDRGQRRRLEYSKSEIRKLWMEHQDPTLVETIESGYGMGFDQPILDMLFDTLSDKDKAFAQAQLDFYKRMYQSVNKVYRERYGVDLPFNEFYSPIQRDQTTSQEGGKDTFGTDLVFTDERTYRRTIPKGILTRVDNVIPLMKRSDVGAMHRYMHDMSWFIEASEKVLHIKSVFKDTKLEADIAIQHGKRMNGLIQGFLEDFGPGYAARGAAAEKIFGTINRQFAGSVLALKGTIGTKQLVSWFAMADNVPAKDFLKSHIDFFKVGKDGKTLRSQEIVKFLWENSAALRARGSSLDFELAKIGAINKPLFTGNAIKVKGRRVTPSMAQWEEWKFAIIKLGDRLPIYAGGWAVYQNAIKQGKTKAQAIQAFEDAFSTTQQSTDIDKLSSLQRAGPIGRTLTMFMTARMALLRGEIRAIRQVKRGKIGYREFGKRMAYYHFIMPMMIQYIASGFEWEDDRQFVAALLGQLNSLVIFGDILMVAAEDIFAEGGSQWQRGDELPVQSIFREIWAGVYDAIESGGDIEELLEAVGDITAAIGLVAGQPLDQIGNILGGVADVTEGDIEKGLKRIWGFSEKVAEKSSK